MNRGPVSGSVFSFLVSLEILVSLETIRSTSAARAIDRVRTTVRADRWHRARDERTSLRVSESAGEGVEITVATAAERSPSVTPLHAVLRCCAYRTDSRRALLILATRNRHALPSRFTRFLRSLAHPSHDVVDAPRIRSDRRQRAPPRSVDRSEGFEIASLGGFDRLNRNFPRAEPPNGVRVRVAADRPKPSLRQRPVE